MNNPSLCLRSTSTDVGICVPKLFNESNFLWTLTKRISLAHHHIADGIFWTGTIQILHFYSLTHSALQYRKRVTNITQASLKHATGQRQKYLWGHLWCEEEDWGSWKCQRHLIRVTSGPAVLDAESARERAQSLHTWCKTPSESDRSRSLQQGEIFVWGLKNPHTHAALHQTYCDTTGTNLPILVPHILIYQRAALSDACERLTLREK